MVFIYILKLQQNKFYIGKTNKPNFRLRDHNDGNGSTWTKKYNPIKLVELIPNCDDFDEDKYTLKYMDLVGIDNVRGGSFCRIKLSDENKNTIEKMLDGTTDKCYKCGEDGHFASKCPKKQSNSKFNMIIKNNNKIIKHSIKLLRESDEYSDYEDKRILVDKLQINIFVEDSIKIIRCLIDSPFITKLVWFNGNQKLIKDYHQWGKIYKIIKFF